MIYDWIGDRMPTEEDGDKDGLIYVFHGGLKSNQALAHWSDLQLGPKWRHTNNWPPTPAPEPTPAALEPEPEKATRGFARIIWHPENHELIAIATDGTAWHKFVACGEWDKWEQIQPLPQPGEE